MESRTINHIKALSLLILMLTAVSLQKVNAQNQPTSPASTQLVSSKQTAKADTGTEAGFYLIRAAGYGLGSFLTTVVTVVGSSLVNQDGERLFVAVSGSILSTAFYLSAWSNIRKAGQAFNKKR